VKDRVLFLVENLSFPQDRRVRAEAESLRDAGYEVTVISPTSPKAPDLEADVGGIRALRFPVSASPGGAVGYLREYLHAAVGVRRIVRRLRNEQPFDVVIAANPPDFLLQLARPLRRRGAGLIFDYHDPAPELFEDMFNRRGLLHRVLVIFERAAQRLADLVITVNEPCAELVRRRGGIPDQNIYVVYNGPDPGKFYPVAPNPELRHGRKHLVLWVGAMSRKEGLGKLIDAADELVHGQGRDDVAFAIVGDGDIRTALEKEIADRNLAGVVFLPGFVEEPLLREYMSTASVCVSLDEPSELNDRSLMIKVLEYMIMGRPVVQYPLQEIKRVCADTAVYLDEGDARDLAAKIAGLINDPEGAEQLGSAARERLFDGFTWPEQVPTLLSAVSRAAAIGRERSKRSRLAATTSAPRVAPAKDEQ
jgi:glycosyltransferase involved in cell wall biosynthesis